MYVIRLNRVSRNITVQNIRKTIKLTQVRRKMVLTQTGRVGPQGETGPTGATGAQGPQGDPGVVQSIVAGTNVTVDDTDPANPIVSATGAVDSVNGQTGVVVLDADDIDDTSTTNKFVTSTDLTKLANTSGTNTGDQDLSGYVPTSRTVNGQALSSNVTLDIDDVAPSQSGNSGKVLKTDGTNATWQDAPSGGGGTWGSITGTLSSQTDLQAALDDKQDILSEGAFVDGDKTKLDGIEALADVTDTTNVTAAGALMDSEVTNLAAVKAFNPADYATAAQGSTADTAVQPGDNISDLTNDAGYTTNTGTVTSVAVSGSDGIDVDSGSPVTTSGTVALGINASTLRTHINVEDGADVTDATNVAAAGATMDTDTSLAGNSYFLDEDDMASNSNAKVPSQQSTKAYVDDRDDKQRAYIDSGIASSLSVALPYSITGVQEIVSTAEREAVDLDYWPDGNIGFIYAGTPFNQIVALASNSVNHAMWLVDPDGDFLDSVIAASAPLSDNLNGDSTFASGGPTYQMSAGSVTVYHGEEEPDANFWSYIGIGKQVETGIKDLGTIIEPNIARLSPNRGGAIDVTAGVSIIKGDYFYTFYKDTMEDGTKYNLCVARCSVADMNAAITAETTPVFKKYYNGEWEEDGIGGLASEICPDTPGFQAFQDIVYMQKYDCYVLVYSYDLADGENWGIGIRFSKDLLTWSDHQILWDDEPLVERLYITATAPLVDDPSFDQRVAPGDDFELYITASSAGGAGRWTDGYVDKRTVTIGRGVMKNYVDENLAKKGVLAYDVYTSNDTWTKPTGAKVVEVFAIGGGGGGGKASAGAAGTNRPGGSGGGPGGAVIGQFDADDLTSTVAVTVGAGGTAGTVTGAFNAGGDGGTSSFGSYVSAGGGVGGPSGNFFLVGQTGGSPGASSLMVAAGGGGAFTGLGFQIPGQPGHVGSGAGGAAISTANVVSPALAGGNSSAGAGGSAGGSSNPGGDGTDGSGTNGGAGGGGGGEAQAGGDGGLGGGAGGGGGAAVSPAVGGDGGAGGRGIVIVITYG